MLASCLCKLGTLMTALRVSLVGCPPKVRAAIREVCPGAAEVPLPSADIILAGSDADLGPLRDTGLPLVVIGEAEVEGLPSLRLSEVRTLPDVIDREVRLARAEREMHEIAACSMRRERQLSLAQQIAGMGSWELDLETNMVSGSPELVRLFGTEQTMARPFDDCFKRCHPEDVERVRATLMRAIETRSDYESEYRVVLRDHIAHVHARGSFVIENGRPVRMIGVIQDVSERRHAEEALRRSEALYRALVEQASDVIFTTDSEGRLTSVNPAFEKLSGWKAEEWIGRYLNDWIDSESLALARGHFQAVLKGETVFGDYQVRTRRGEPVTVEVSAQPLITEGSPAGLIGLARDVTRRREQEARAEKEKRLASLGHLAAAVAHEFNNVLMSILPFAELLKRRAGSDEKVDVATRHIFQAIRRGRQVSQEILRFSRTNAVAISAIDVREWLERFAREASALLGPRYVIRAEVLIDEERIYVKADRGLLDQVATNLLLNARDAMPEGGFVNLEVRRSTLEVDRIEISVRDSGCGIPEDQIERIFDPLFTTKPGATGLGLSVALQGMMQQEGSIRVSSSVGTGTTFTLVLRETESPSRSAGDEEPGVERQKRILLVEDDEAVGEGIRTLLADDGFDVRLVTRGREAANAVREFAPDVTILDVNLGDISGVDVFETLRTEWPDIRVIFSTGHADSAALEDVRRRHVPTIMKPYEIADLVSIIRQVSSAVPAQT